MAIITDNKNGSLTVVLTADEQFTFMGLPINQLQDYVTLWLADHASRVLQQRFEKLSVQDKVDVQTKMDAAMSVEKVG